MIKMRDLLKESFIENRVKSKIKDFNNIPNISEKSDINRNQATDLIGWILEIVENDIKIMMNANRNPIQGSRFQYFPGSMDMNPKITEEKPILYLNHLVNKGLKETGTKNVNKQIFRHIRALLGGEIYDLLASKRIKRDDYEVDMSGL